MLAPIPGTPAFVAGIQIGDEIIEIDGENVEGKIVPKPLNYCEAQLTEPVDLTIERNGETLKKKNCGKPSPCPASVVTFVYLMVSGNMF